MGDVLLHVLCAFVHWRLGGDGFVSEKERFTRVHPKEDGRDAEGSDDGMGRTARGFSGSCFELCNNSGLFPLKKKHHTHKTSSQTAQPPWLWEAMTLMNHESQGPSRHSAESHCSAGRPEAHLEQKSRKFGSEPKSCYPVFLILFF